MNRFAAFARRVSDLAGRPLAFILACLLVATWAATGPLFAYSDTWQLVINTGTTVVTFLMVFVLQGAQVRDQAAAQAKLDELIKATDTANDALIDIEHDSDEQMAAAREAARNTKVAECP